MVPSGMDSISKTFFPSAAGMILTVNSLARAPSTRPINASAAALGAARATGGPGWIGAGEVVAAGSMEQMTSDNRMERVIMARWDTAWRWIAILQVDPLDFSEGQRMVHP